MITIEQNPSDVRAAYLAGLNVCFPGWGGEARFEWALTRTFAGQAPDVLVVREDERIVAGTGVSYRNVDLRNGARVRVGIMTGSWTLPEERRRGHFQRMIEASQRCAGERGASALLAFVTATNPSYRRLVNAGAAQWETNYLASAQEPNRAESRVTIQRISDVKGGVEKILQRRAATAGQEARFVYGVEDWIGQFVKRPAETEVVRLGEDGAAVIESDATTDRILYLLCPRGAEFEDAFAALATRTAERKRRMMFFTSAAAEAETAARFGMERVRGYLTALPVLCNGETKLPQGWEALGWDVQSGDRM